LLERVCVCVLVCLSLCHIYVNNFFI
jgi:hypothetical protein